MTSSRFSFLRRVRIHGGECGAVARALHHAAQKVALVRNEQALISDEKAFSRQADSRKVLGSTIERKQMSTKTTLKRIALVAVSALGFGLMTSVAPATAGDHTPYVSSITVTTDKVPVAGANGTAVEHTVRFSTSTITAQTVQPNVILTSKPSGSAMAIKTLAQTPLLAGTFQVSSVATVAAAVNAQGVDLTSAVEAGFANRQALAYIQAYYDLPGTYTYTIFDDATDDGVVSGADVSTTFTVVVGATGSSATYTGAMSVLAGASTITNSDFGALVRVNLKDAAANNASPDTAGGVRVSVTGTGRVSRVFNATTASWSDITGVATYTLGANNFDGSGNAYFNVTNATSETVVVSLAGSGSMATSFTAPSAVSIAFAAESESCTGTACTINAGAATGLQVNMADAAGTDGAADANRAGGTLTFATGAVNTTTSAFRDAILVTDTSGAITGKAGAKYNIGVTAAANGSTATYRGTFSITPAWTATVSGQTFTLQHTAVASGSDTDVAGGMVVTSEAATVETVTTLSSTAFRAAPGATHTFLVEADNQFGVGAAGVAVSASIAGRNSTVNVASAITNADGIATLTYKDASTSTTSLTDTVTFSSNSKISSAVINYVSAANFGAGSVLLTTAVSKTTGADADVLASMYWDIAAGAAGPTAGKQPVTVTVRDANSVVLSGVPVTLSVTGTGCAITTPTRTVFTGPAGTATANVYGWIEGRCVVTGTVGSLTASVNTYWFQNTPGETRTYTAVSNNARTVTVTAKDRFGNNVVGAAFTGTIIGDGFFGTGTNVATGVTGTDGTLRFLTLADTKDVTVRVTINDSTNYQADASKGLVASNTATDIFTAAAAGDSVTEETGVGITFDAAGTLVANPNGLDAVVKGAPDASTVAAEAASDAALEAIDAANAATDAANLAAEAADAATVAAEEARDAADAATAAVEALASEVATLIAGLKAQITTLANTVAKIAKRVRA